MYLIGKLDSILVEQCKPMPDRSKPRSEVSPALLTGTDSQVSTERTTAAPKHGICLRGIEISQPIEMTKPHWREH